MPRTAQLLIIDPQNDFCDVPVAYRPQDPLAAADAPPIAPSLPVPGAHADMLRLAQFIDQVGDRLDAITVTLDSHHSVGIERPGFWMLPDGSPVPPFTPITLAAFRAGDYVLRDVTQSERVAAYLQALEAAGRYTHMVWPAHCEIGTWGHNVHAAIARAYGRWEHRHARIARKVLKGSNPYTEHYSAIRAEVPESTDVQTNVNRELLAALEKAPLLLVAGEAGSHCVRGTVEHIIEYLGNTCPPIMLLTDCMSPVSGFEAPYADFLARMKAGTNTTLTSTEAALRELHG